MINVFLIFVIICTFSGVLAGMIGIGGGALLVPLFLYVLPQFGIELYTMQMALGTSLACVAVNVSIATKSQIKRNGVDFEITKYWAFFIMIGGIIGSFWASGADDTILKIIYVAVMLFIVSVRLFRPTKVFFSRNSLFKSGLIFPTSVGFVAATMGLGAGNAVPALGLFGVPMNRAVGTASFLGLFIAFPSSIVYAYAGYGAYDFSTYTVGFVHIPLFFVTVVISGLSVPIGVMLSHKMSSKVLNRVFCVVSLMLTLRMVSEI